MSEFLTLKTSQLAILGCFFIRKTLIIFALGNPKERILQETFVILIAKE